MEGPQKIAMTKYLRRRLRKSKERATAILETKIKKRGEKQTERIEDYVT